MKPDILEKKIQQKKKTTEIISATEAKILLENEKALLLDVREPVEFATEHIPKAINQPLGNLDPKALEKKMKGRILIVQCLTGNRSKMACKRLRNRLSNYRNLTLDGGLTAWKKAGFATVKKKSTISLFRQIQITAGFFVFTGSLLALTTSITFIAIPLFFGGGLLFAGVSGWCGMGVFLSKFPWNR